MLFGSKRFLRTVSPLLLVALAGCSDTNIVPVTGTLTYKGQPVPNAYVDFIPEDGRPSWGETDEQGRFKLNYDVKHDGAIVGKHKVSVRRKPVTTEEREAEMLGKKLPMSQEMATFFDKYSSEKSTVEVTIDKNTRDLKLDWD
jgi:hypothetical protein